MNSRFLGSCKQPFLLTLVSLYFLPLLAQCAALEEADYQFNPELFDGMEWRNIGPFRGGRVTTVAGVPGEPHRFYFGSVGGGVWLTENAGDDWRNISDGFFETSSVGAIAVAASDPNVIVVGMGEAPIRGVASSHGDGVYKSTDAGKSWVHIGLDDTRQISAVRIHPTDPEILYVAAQGSPWAPTDERGIYRSLDGGGEWERVLHVGATAGASDLAMDVTNPRVLYAAFWDHQRTPWQIRSGGPGSGIHKSTDGGETWSRLSDGLPEEMGKVRVAVSPARPDRVWAMIESNEEQGGLYRSDDAGKTWRRVNDHRALRARAWYYTHVIADPLDEETVYVLAAPMLKSTDGGKTFTRIPTPHGDNHALWISPENNQWMINSNDGGANVSLDGGRTWSTQGNQPTGQFYRVIADNRIPYHLYGAQQDNTTVAIANRSFSGGIGREHWYPVGGGESAHIALDPDDPELVYATDNRGGITEYDQETGVIRNVMAYPKLGLGADAREYKYRFIWNAPVLVSVHDSQVIYHGGNVVLKSTDRGQNWTAISPDLTRNEKEKQQKGGVPFTNEAAGAEIYNTIIYLAESRHEKGTLWAGTDDGLVHITRDEGSTWTNVTPGSLGEAQVNSIEISPHDPAVAYITVTRYKFGDFRPMIFRTDDYGRRWKSIVNGIPDDTFARVVREDPDRRGLLYAGTETGIFVSFDDGGRWQPLQLNLPVTPVTDIRVHRKDLLVATQGRSFWILDDPEPLRQLDDDVAERDAHLYRPATASRLQGGGGFSSNPGKNPPNGAVIYYYLSEAPGTDGTPVALTVLDESGKVLRGVGTEKDPNLECARQNAATDVYESRRESRFTVRQGMNRYVWDLRRDNITCIPGLFFAFGWEGPRVVPGDYTVRLTVGGTSMEQPMTITGDPRTSVVPRDFAEHSELMDELYRTINEVHRSVNTMQALRRQAMSRIDLTRHHPDSAKIEEAANALIETITAWEDEVIQPRQQTRQDVANYPNRLNANLIHLMEMIDESVPPVTSGMKELFTDLMNSWADTRGRMTLLLENELAAFNALLQQSSVPPLYIPPEQGT